MDEPEKTKLTPDLTELGVLCGCTPKQVAFAAGLLEGLSQTEAAFNAGYSGDRNSSQLRSAGSAAARMKPVQALLALAESRGLGVPSSPGDMNELRAILWQHARSKDKNHSIAASKELMRLEAEEKAIEKPIPHPHEVLSEIAAESPLYAMELATKHGCWQYKLTEEQQAVLEQERRKIALTYITEKQGQPLTNGLDSTSTQKD
jgi:hypothetical protein